MGKHKENGGLEAFILALLAKQGWRLLHHVETLAEKVFCEKYNPGELFSRVQPKKETFLRMRSIWNAKKLLPEGLIWKVGNREGREGLIWKVENRE